MIWKATKYLLAFSFVTDTAFWAHAYFTNDNDALMFRLTGVLFDAVMITLCALVPDDDSDDDKGDGPPLKVKTA